MLSIIIPTFNDDLRLEWVLEGICRQTHRDFEVIVVNDGGNAGTEQLAQRFRDCFPLRYLYLQPPSDCYRVAAARNLGAVHSRGDQLVFLDGDTVPDPDLFALLAREFRHDRILNPLRREFPARELRPFQPPLDYDWLERCSNPPPRIEELRRGVVVHPWGYCYSLPADVFFRIGGWDEQFRGWGWEDADMNIRLHKLGFQDTVIGERGWCTHLDHPRRSVSLPEEGRRAIVESWRRSSPVRNGGPLRRESGDLPEPYRSLRLLPPDGQGWLHESTRRGLERLLCEGSAAVVVELGSWLGLSTRFIAQHLPPGGRVYAVDTWQGSADLAQQPELARRLPHLYQQFLSNIRHAGLERQVVPLRMNTQEAAAALDAWPDLVYVDASHAEEDVVADILSWQPKLVPGGAICGDDWANYASVRRGVERAARELRCSFAHDGNFWWLVS